MTFEAAVTVAADPHEERSSTGSLTKRQLYSVAVH